MKRWEIVDFLKEILRACGESIAFEMILVKGEGSMAIDEGNFKLLWKAQLDEITLKCVEDVAKKFNVDMKEENGLWVFGKANNVKNVTFSAIARQE
jgi:hypothetical protein